MKIDPIGFHYKNFLEFYKNPEVQKNLLERFGISLNGNELQIGNLKFSDLVKNYKSPLDIIYTETIRKNVSDFQKIFDEKIQKLNYNGNYKYLYCTKPNHFKDVLETVLQVPETGLESSSFFDITIFKNLFEDGFITKETPLIHNGYKPDNYLKGISELSKMGLNTFLVFDSFDEILRSKNLIKHKQKVGIRLATFENGKTSRLGISENIIDEIIENEIFENTKFDLKIVHFFINGGMYDTKEFWEEFRRLVKLYTKLKKVFPSIEFLDIGGGMKVSFSLETKIDYDNFIEKIIKNIKEVCEENNCENPNIFTEFGTYSVAESGINILSTIGVKNQFEYL